MTKLSLELITAVAEAVRRDMPNIEACALFNISEWSFYDWKRKGDADIEKGVESLYASFSQAIKKAESQAIDEGLSVIRAAAHLPNNWTARAWILERCYRKRFSVQGDALERLERQMQELALRFEKRNDKSVGAKAQDGEMGNGKGTKKV